ncbi:MAG TPA: citrate/2-methylcitrate synthase [Myxococcales bacterium]|nr:citrate/2-methylcitrate synthase [Myxococcales bacterium]
MDDPINTSEQLVSARQAAKLLGIKLGSLYAYVSRGLVRSVSGEGRKARLYVRSDLERLRARRDAHRGHAPVAAGALRWGEPVLDSAISGIDGAGPLYRGHRAVRLAVEGTPFEPVAELLWTGTLPAPAPEWPRPERPLDLRRLAELLPDGSPPVAVMAAMAPLLAVADAGRFGAAADAELHRARRLIRHLAASFALPRAPARAAEALAAPSISAAVCLALGLPRRAAAREAVDRALVLCADHELTASTFAARIAASAGCDLYACTQAALAVVQGPEHGGACDRIDALVAEAGRPERAAATVRDRARRGEALPGFNHRLYPRGDPRGPPLLAAAEALAPRSPGVRTMAALVEAMRALGHPGPSVDAGLVALAAALGLPAGSAVGLFALGRSAGWIAHALEQRAAGFMLRPRARYVGPPAST